MEGTQERVLWRGLVLVALNLQFLPPEIINKALMAIILMLISADILCDD
jgi:hypothetical protein